MKVFFVGSPRALSEYGDSLKRIYHTISKLGHENLYDLMINSDPSTFYIRSKEEITKHYTRTITTLQKSDVVIVESSIHSLSMGYLIRMAEEFDKPVIILYRPSNEPFFFSGNFSEKFILAEYTDENITKVLSECFEYAREMLDIRFNLFLVPQMHTYLKLASKKQGVPCSSFVRSLIENSMAQHPEILANKH